MNLRILPIAVVGLISVSHAAADEDGLPRPACSVQEIIPVVLFPQPAPDVSNIDGFTGDEIIRSVRSCRYRSIRLVVFADENARMVAEQSVSHVITALAVRTWPATQISVVFAPRSEAPTGPGLDAPWQVAVEVLYLDRNPNWQPPMEQPTFSCKPTVAGRADCKPLPFSAPQAAATSLWPPGTYDPPTIFFEPMSVSLNGEARSVTQRAAHIMTDANYRFIALTAYPDPGERNSRGLARERAAAVRRELVAFGIDSNAIQVKIAKRAYPLVTGTSQDRWFKHAVAVDYSDY